METKQFRNNVQNDLVDKRLNKKAWKLPGFSHFTRFFGIAR
jgi:hypothetical protein